MFTVPGTVIRFAGTLAVSLLLLENAVASGVAPHMAVAPAAKFEPLIVIVNGPLPDGVELGLRVEVDGVGTVTVKFAGVVGAPPGFATLTLIAPALDSRLAPIAAVNCDEVTNVVARDAEFHLTTAPETKFEPLTVSVKAEAPLAAEAGDRLLMEGAAGAVGDQPRNRL